MKVYLHYRIHRGSDQSPFATMAKRIKTDVIPIPGILVEDIAFQEGPGMSDEITVDFEEGCYTVILPRDERPSEEECRHLVKHFEANGWIRLEELIRRESAPHVRFLSTERFIP